ncbi:L-asparaginase II [Aureobasidium pullulans]|uniref:L-asparaginase II n=1 Tax=Aureobasidium pullulans TaxID=5580 RepID=A0A4S9WK84_AURPU|nr:L-asparaginase II [Aureobasidium pullulans]
MDSHDLVLNWRGGVVENSHIVHAAIVDSENNLLFSLGDPNRLTLARSAAKPFQALAILETGAAEKFNFDEADVALMCGSHNSENKHVSRVTAMLDKAGVSEENMNCGGHPALSKIINNGWIKDGFAPTAIYSNCSAKHVGMLAAAKSLDAGIENYHDPAHPVQAEIKRVHEDLSKLKPEEIYWVIDGCNAPSPALPLSSMALMYAALANAADQEKPTDQSIQNQARVFNAMVTHPEMIGGDSRFCTDLMRAFSGALVGKLGAEGCYGIGVRDCESTRRLGAKNGLGIAIKIEDGNIDMLYVALMEVLTRLDIGTEDVRESLKTTHCTMPKNTMGVVTGHTSFKMDLNKRN